MPELHHVALAALAFLLPTAGTAQPKSPPAGAYGAPGKTASKENPKESPKATPKETAAPASKDAPKPDAGAEAATKAAGLVVPTAAEAKRVIDYYYAGKTQGPVLVELKACTKLDTSKDSPNRNECVEEVKGPVKKGSNVHAWTMWLVPDGGDYEDATIQFLYEDQVRSTMDIRLTTALRSRTFRANTVTRAGKWFVKVFRGGTELASVPFTVVD